MNDFNVPFRFEIVSSDLRNRSANAILEIFLVGSDEHTPLFSRPSYTFKVIDKLLQESIDQLICINVEVQFPPKPGQKLGQVFATDKDRGFGILFFKV